MARTSEQNTEFVATFLSTKERISGVKVVDRQILEVERESLEPFKAGIISMPSVTIDFIQPFVGTSPVVDIVANIPKEAMWIGSAIKFAQSNLMAYGGLKDLLSATSEEDVRQYVRSEFKFVERGLYQHDRVSHLERLYDRVYLVHRYNLPSISFVMLNEYELTSDHIRTARSRYGKFDLILLNNPNGRPGTDALEPGS